MYLFGPSPWQISIVFKQWSFRILTCHICGKFTHLGSRTCNLKSNWKAWIFYKKTPLSWLHNNGALTDSNNGSFLGRLIFTIINVVPIADQTIDVTVGIQIMNNCLDFYTRISFFNSPQNARVTLHSCCCHSAAVLSSEVQRLLFRPSVPTAKRLNIVCRRGAFKRQSLHIRAISVVKIVFWSKKWSIWSNGKGPKRARVPFPLWESNISTSNTLEPL